MYGDDLAEVYELVHEARGKDYAAEATLVAAAIRDEMPAAARLLDVACGTGSHLRAFAGLFDHVEGLELAPAMLSAARGALPGVPVHQGDMRDFDLGREFDALTCMFGSIGYMDDLTELSQALGRFARHVVPGGVVAIDPWWFLETFADGYVSADVVTVDERTVARVSHSARHGTRSHQDVHFVVAGAGGARHFVDTHVITLFTREQYETAFTGAGLKVVYHPEVQSGRGLFIGVRQ